MANTNTSKQISITDLPVEMVLEIAKHCEPPEFVNLYSTCKYLKEILCLDYKKVCDEYFKNKLFQQFIEIFVQQTRSIPVFMFDFFSKDNDKSYNSKIPSYKYFYEKLTNKKMDFNTYCKCLDNLDYVIYDVESNDIRLDSENESREVFHYETDPKYEDMISGKVSKQQIREYAFNRLLDAMDVHFSMVCFHYITKIFKAVLNSSKEKFMVYYERAKVSYSCF
jgi:hypothetical protein